LHIHGESAQIYAHRTSTAAVVSRYLDTLTLGRIQKGFGLTRFPPLEVGYCFLDGFRSVAQDMANALILQAHCKHLLLIHCHTSSHEGQNL